MPPMSSGAVVCRSRRRAKSPSCRCSQPLVGIPGGAHSLPPGLVGQVPVDGPGYAGFEVVRGLPGECGLRRRGVDFITEIMPRPVGDIADQPLAWPGRVQQTLVEV